MLDLIARAAVHDPSLAFRYSCRSGFCGTCTVLLDGRPVLGCQTPVPAAAVLELAPLGGFPVIRDLVVDAAPFAERWDRIMPADLGKHPGDALPRPLDPAAGPARVADSVDCIACGACFAACDMASSDVPFLGPAALTRAMVMIADPRDVSRTRRLALVAGADGVEGCHGIGACSLACPKDLDPQRAIRRLRRWQVTGAP